MALNTGINSLDAGAPELRLEGEQQAGGPYNQGSDVKNALAVWSNMGPEDRMEFEGFLDFFRTGAWRDQIQGMRQMERNRRTAAQGGVADIGFSKVKPSNDGSRPGYFTAQYGGTGAGRGADPAPSGGGGGWQSYAIPSTAATAASENIAPTTTIAALEAAQNIPDDLLLSTILQGPTLPEKPAVLEGVDTRGVEPRLTAEQLTEGDIGLQDLTGRADLLTEGDIGLGQYPITDQARAKIESIPDIDPGPTDYEWETAPDKVTMAGPVYTGDEDTEGQAEKDLDWALKFGILEENPNTGEIGEGPNIRDLDTGVIGPKPEPEVTTGGEGINVPGTPIVPVEDTGLSEAEAEAEATAAQQAELERLRALYGSTKFPTGIASAKELPFYDPNLAIQPQVAARGGRIGYDRGGVAGIRQPFLFGGIGKVFKKAKDVVKKVVKSPVGKALLGYGLGTYLGGTKFLGGTGNLSPWERFTKPGLLRNLISPSKWSPFQTVDANTQVANILEKYGLEKNEKNVKWAIDQLQKKTAKKGLGVPDYVAMAGIPLAMAGTAKYAAADQGDDQEEMSKFLARQKLDTDPWREKFKSKQFDITQQAMPYTFPALAAKGGRIGYEGGLLVDDDDDYVSPREAALAALYNPQGTYVQRRRGVMAAAGGRVAAQEGGLMNLGGMEKDYRQEGGFVPIGGEEKADDVPARLSKNEFVFTADAVRAAGGGDIDAGAEVMENVMENLEAGGKVSEESQGLEGARNMFATSQRLQNRII